MPIGAIGCKERKFTGVTCPKAGRNNGMGLTCLMFLAFSGNLTSLPGNRPKEHVYMQAKLKSGGGHSGRCTSRCGTESRKNRRHEQEVTCGNAGVQGNSAGLAVRRSKGGRTTKGMKKIMAAHGQLGGGLNRVTGEKKAISMSDIFQQEKGLGSVEMVVNLPRRGACLVEGVWGFSNRLRFSDLGSVRTGPEEWSASLGVSRGHLASVSFLMKSPRKWAGNELSIGLKGGKIECAGGGCRDEAVP